MRCQLGVILRAPAGAAPRYDAPFLIIDRQLVVQAVSRNAEVVLSVDEPTGVGIPLRELLICDNGEVALVVDLAMAGGEQSDGLELRTVAIPEIRLRGRVTCCGAPPAALLVLTPLAVHAAAPNEWPATNGHLAGVGAPDSAA